jgi:HSP20 family protein
MNALVRHHGHEHHGHEVGKELLWDPWKDFVGMERFWDKFESFPELDPMLCPKVDLKEDKKSFTVTTQLSGFPKEDIKVDYDLGVLTISAEKKAEKVKKGERHHRREQECGYFCNRIALPQKIDGSKIHADYKNGMLKVELPKSEEKTAVEIKVK